MTQPDRIDVHHHFVPPGYAEWLAEQGVMDSGGRSLPAWSRGAATEMMEAHGISAALLSLGGPGVHFGGDGQARTWARRANEFAAEVVKDHPDQFGFLATLPLPDVEGAVAAAAWALDELGADGVMLLANSGGVYLGDPRLEPVMAELDRRAAVVFVHPAALPDAAVAGIPPFAVDFLLDTTRAAANLVRHQVPQRYPRLRFVLAHGGGFLPFASHRIALTLAELTGPRTDRRAGRPDELLVRHRIVKQPSRATEPHGVRASRPDCVRLGLAVRPRAGGRLFHRRDGLHRRRRPGDTRRDRPRRGVDTIPSAEPMMPPSGLCASLSGRPTGTNCCGSGSAPSQRINDFKNTDLPVPVPA